MTLDQVVAAFHLNFDVAPGLAPAHAQADQRVVDDDDVEPDEDEQSDDDVEGGHGVRIDGAAASADVTLARLALPVYVPGLKDSLILLLPAGKTPRAERRHEAVRQVEKTLHRLAEPATDFQHLVDAPIEEGPSRLVALGPVVEPEQRG